MWTVIKFEKKKINFLKQELINKLGHEVVIYCPKILIQKFKKDKLEKREFNLLGDYIFCYHKQFSKISFLKQLNFLRGVKYFLDGFHSSQNEINTFIKRCKSLENSEGYISQGLYQAQINKCYKFSSGPFADKIFKIIQLQKNKIDILMGNIKTTINKNEFLFNPS